MNDSETSQDYTPNIRIVLKISQAILRAKFGLEKISGYPSLDIQIPSE